MPEGVEITIQTNILNRECKGKTIIGIQWDKKKFKKSGVSEFNLVKLPLEIKKVWCRGKVIVFEMTNGLYMVSQLGMSGFWSTTKGNHSNFWINFGHSTDKGYIFEKRIYYDDQRRFGHIGFYTDLKKIWSRHGPCLMLASLIQHGEKLELEKDQIVCSLDHYKTQIRNKRLGSDKRIAEFMMEQNRAAGVGNYLRAEILYDSGISPTRTLISLSDGDIETLYNSTLRIMWKSYSQKGKYHQGEKCGDSFSLKVYKQTVDPNGYEVITFPDKNKRMCYYVAEVQN